MLLYLQNSCIAVFDIWDYAARSKIQRSKEVISFIPFHNKVGFIPIVCGGGFNWKWKFLYLSPDYHSRWRAIKINEWWCASVRALQNAGGVLTHTHPHLRFSYHRFHLTFGLHTKGKEGGNHTGLVCVCNLCVCVPVHICACVFCGKKKMVYIRLLSIEQLRMQETRSKCCVERLSSATRKTETLTSYIIIITIIIRQTQKHTPYTHTLRGWQDVGESQQGGGNIWEIKTSL